MTLNQQLHEQLEIILVNTGKQANLIAINPNTLDELIAEFPLADVPNMPERNLNLRYRTVRMVRSFDVAEGVFEIA